MITIQLIQTEDGLIPERLLTNEEMKTVIQTSVNINQSIHFQSKEEIDNYFNNKIIL